MDDKSIGIYPTAWLFEHACRPNARIGVDEAGTLRLTALTRIKAEANVSFCYVDP